MNQVIADASASKAASSLLPKGEDVYKVVKYLDLSVTIEMILVRSKMN